MFNFFVENKLTSSNQSGFKPGDSYINQLLSITYEINKSFDVGFDGIIYKLTQNGVSGNLLNLLENFLRERKQCVVLNG